MRTEDIERLVLNETLSPQILATQAMCNQLVESAGLSSFQVARQQSPDSRVKYYDPSDIRIYIPLGIY